MDTTNTIENTKSLLEDFAKRLLEWQFSSLNDLWHFQLDLAKQQMNIEENIIQERTAKENIEAEIRQLAKDKTLGWKTNIQECQLRLRKVEQNISEFKELRKLFRQIGDALAWILLDGKRYVGPLSMNDQVPPVQDKRSFSCMLSVAQNFSNKGLGFPLIHDITNCLRIGDITFINWGEEPITVEVKTRVRSANSEKGTVVMDGSCLFLKGPKRWEEFFETISAETTTNAIDDSISIPSGTDPESDLSDSVLKQLKRMSKAKTLQTSSSEIVEGIGDFPLLMSEVYIDTKKYHWNTLINLAEDAKRQGYASKVVDDAILYVVLYDKETLGLDENGKIPYQDDLDNDRKTLLPKCAQKENDSIYFGTTLRYHTGYISPQSPPLLLYKLPIEYVIDLLRGRMIIVVIVNLGKIVERLRANNIDADLANDPNNRIPQLISVSYQKQLNPNQRITIRSSEIFNEHLDALTTEFLSVDGLMQIITESLSTMVQLVAEKELYSTP